MKQILLSSLVLLALATVTHASDNVPAGTLSEVGLAQLQPLSDSEGMQIRGMSSSARATGSSAFSIFLLDPNTGSFLQIQGGDFATASEENGGNQEQSGASQGNQAVFNGLPLTTITAGGNVTTWTVGAFGLGGTSTATAQ